MKNIMITGSSGFVGKNLHEYLMDKYNVYPLTHKNLDLLNENEVRKFFNNNKIDIVIHCANSGGSRKTGYGKEDVDITKNNLKMFFNIVRCLNDDIKMIDFGSGAEYDKRYSLCKVSEEDFDKNVPEDSYGYSKYVMAKYLENVNNITCLRIFGLYGKYEDYTFKFISNAIIKNLAHNSIIINQNVVFDYLYIDDLMKMVDKFIENNYNDKIFNVTPTESIDLVSIAKIINSISDFKSDIVVLNEGLNKEYTGDNSRLLKNLKDFRFTSYEEGIRNLYNYYKSIIKDIDIDEIKQDKYLDFCKTNK